MAEKVNKLILETEYKVTGTEISVSKLTDLKKATDSITQANTAKVEADKKVEQAANQLNKTIETETKKQTELAKAITETGKAMNTIAQTNSLKEAFTDTGVKDFTAELKAFQDAARKATSIEELTQAVDEFVKSLPEDVQGEVFGLIEKEVAKLEKTLINPVARLRELKRLINTETDPVLLQEYAKEAAELQKQLSDTNKLVKQLGSDTFFVDTVVEGAQQAVGAFTAFQGVLALTTDDQEKFAQAAAKAQGALALLQGTQQILTNLKKSDNIITRAQIISQQVYAKVVGTSTGAMKGFRLALAATGIGLAVILLTQLAAKFFEAGENVKKFNAERERNNRISAFVQENYAKEAAKIEVTRQALLDVNTPQSERVRIIQEAQKDYPGFLQNIDAEKSSYADIAKELDRLNRALLIKFEIQAREEELVKLIGQRLKAEDIAAKAQAASVKAQEDVLKNAQDINAEQLKFEQQLAGALGSGIALQAEKEAADIEKVITGIIDEIINKNKELSTITGNTASAGVRSTSEVLAGSIAALEAEVSRLTKLRDDLTVVGSEANIKANEDLQLAIKQLEEAKALYGKPIQAELFAEGSLKALQKQVNDLNEIVSSLGAGAERDEAVAKLKQAQAALDAERALIFGKEEEQAKESNETLFSEEERHQLAMQGIEGDSNANKLKTQLSYAQERLKILEESGTATEAELEKQRNAVLEIEAELNRELSEQDKKRKEERIKGITSLVLEAKALADTLIQIEIDRYTRLAELQQERVRQAAEIADQGNAELLQLEEERLNDLNQKREAFVRRQQQLAQIQLVAESMLAIAKAAAQGGAAAPFTIAATLIALAAGLAQARAAAQAQSFRKGGVFEGGYTGQGAPGVASTQLGAKPYEYHYREHIMPDPVVRIGNNLKWLEKIRMERIDIGAMMAKKTGVNVSPIIQTSQSSPNFNFNLNSKGIISIVESDEKNRKRIKSKIK